MRFIHYEDLAVSGIWKSQHRHVDISIYIGIDLCVFYFDEVLYKCNIVQHCKNWHCKNFIFALQFCSQKNKAFMPNAPRHFFMCLWCFYVSVTLVQSFISLRFTLPEVFIGVIGLLSFRKYPKFLKTSQQNSEGGILVEYTRTHFQELLKKQFRTAILQRPCERLLLKNVTQQQTLSCYLSEF